MPRQAKHRLYLFTRLRRASSLKVEPVSNELAVFVPPIPCAAMNPRRRAQLEIPIPSKSALAVSGNKLRTQAF